MITTMKGNVLASMINQIKMNDDKINYNINLFHLEVSLLYEVSIR